MGRTAAFSGGKDDGEAAIVGEQGKLRPVGSESSTLGNPSAFLVQVRVRVVVFGGLSAFLVQVRVPVGHKA